MSLLGTKRTELLLYGVLLVLPTVVLAWLHWHQLVVDHESELARAPREAGDAARRLRDSVVRHVRGLLAEENARPFYVWHEAYFPPDAIGAELVFVPSPLVSRAAPEGLLAWFAYDADRAKETEIELLVPPGSPLSVAERDELVGSAYELAEHDRDENLLETIGRNTGLDSRTIPLIVAAINQSPEEDLDCLRAELPALRQLADETIEILLYSFYLRCYWDSADRLVVVGTRRVILSPNHKMRYMPACWESLGWGSTLVQGFFLDPEWLFGELPRARAREVLDARDSYLGPGTFPPELGEGEALIEFNLLDELGVETYRPEDRALGRMGVAVSSLDVRGRYRAQVLRLLGVTVMLGISLAIGMALLLQSVRRDLEQARRTENFVSAVTHELRTPIAAVRLYGEMLRDGWAASAEKRGEYYERIVREARRLETTVDRVLEKGRITSTDLQPAPGDLEAVVGAVVAELVPLGAAAGVDGAPPRPDVEYRRSGDLPPVMLHAEGVRSIVVNLVENARKYAPPARDRTDFEPILVGTRMHKQKVVLEVLDRGPGIPAAERARVFDAFYRIGNEATRATQGTGLGLHLVAQHARSMGARVVTQPRKGGGTEFRVTFATARGSARRRGDGDSRRA